MTTISAHFKPWRPEKPTSRGATAYHDAVIDAPYYVKNLDELFSIVNQRIKEGNIVVDFGAGTGVSALHFLKKMNVNITLLLVDNSPAWLGKAYEILSHNPNVQFFLLEKVNDRYATLSETIGNVVVDNVFSANTVHLIPDIREVFIGISQALRKNGSFTFQTGNFIRDNKPEGALMIDDTIKNVHDIALDIVKTEDKFAVYREGLIERVKAEEIQRKFVFPDPRPIEFYLESLEEAGFSYEEPLFLPVRIKYNDWLNFLRVKRLQAGILPEIGGIQPSPKEEEDRNSLITESALRLFKELAANNPLADDTHFTVESAYVDSIKK